MGALGVQLGDDIGNGITDARNVREAALRDQRPEWFCQRANALRRSDVGLGAIGIAAP